VPANAQSVVTGAVFRVELAKQADDERPTASMQRFALSVASAAKVGVDAQASEDAGTAEAHWSAVNHRVPQTLRLPGVKTSRSAGV
jgi:hypothetical protein